jgi:iron complex outermembrane receptor protein
MVSDKLRFAQQYGAGTPYLSRLNTVGLNTSFTTVRLAGRAGVGWSLAGWSAGLFANYTGGYWNRLSNAVAVSGPRGQRVSSYTTIDARLSYAPQGRGWLGDTEVYVDARNLFDKDPPFVNFPGAFNPSDSNPIGRLVSFGLRKTL